MANSAIGVLEEGFGLVEKNYIKVLELYLLIVFIYAVIITIGVILVLAFGFLGAAATTSATAGGGFALGVLFAFIALFAIIFLIEPIYIGAYYSIALQSLKGGQVSVIYAIKQAMSKYVPLLWTIALEALIVVVIDVLIFSPLIISAIHLFSTTGLSSISSGGTSSAVFSLIGLALLLVLVYLVVSAVLAPLLYEAVPLVMIEGTGGVKAIRESIDIGEKHFWSILGLVVGILLIYGGVGFVEDIIVFVFSAVSVALGQAVDLILGILIGSFMIAWTTILPVIYYNDYFDSMPQKKKLSG